MCLIELIFNLKNIVLFYKVELLKSVNCIENKSTQFFYFFLMLFSTNGVKHQSM